jgi:hypothetical protein
VIEARTASMVPASMRPPKESGGVTLVEVELRGRDFLRPGLQPAATNAATAVNAP